MSTSPKNPKAAAIIKWLGRGAKWAFVCLMVFVLVAAVAIRFVPLPTALFRMPPEARAFTDRHGTLLRETPVAGAYGREIPYSEIPKLMVDAMLAAEDRRFFSHDGVDLLAVGRAAFGNSRSGRVTSGASTITQQLVKNARPKARTWRTKIEEAVLAIRLEQVWTKEQILAAYLNRIDFGNLNRGVAAAAAYYFGKPLADLSPAEAAFIAGLPKNPTRLNPHKHPVAAQRRQHSVLARMERNGVVSPEDHARSRLEPLHLRPQTRTFLAPHFVDLIAAGLDDGTGPVKTTLDLPLQRQVESMIRSRILPLASKNVRNAAAVVIENQTGHVLALCGSENYFAPFVGQVNGAFAPRSPGSALKPFAYLLALERGDHPATILADVPAEFATATGVYQPENYEQRCFGPIRMRMALGNSLNIPAVRVLASLGGPQPLRQRLESWGVRTLTRPTDGYGLGLVIGNAEVRLLELANAYAALARLGDYRPYTLALEPHIVSSEPSHAGPKPDPIAAWLLADMLSDNDARALQFGRRSALRFEFPVACKTGTSTDYRDNWAFGYTPEYTVGVWAGNFDGSPMRDVSGVTGAAPILHDIVVHLHDNRGTTWYARPPEIVEHAVHPITGKRLIQPRADAIRERFAFDHLPPMESPSDYDAAGRAILGPEYRGWLQSTENALSAKVSDMPSSENLRLIGPIPGTTFVIDPDVPSTNRIPLLATAPNLLSWHSETLPFVIENGRTYAIASEGEHHITVRSPGTDESAETWIVIKSL